MRKIICLLSLAVMAACGSSTEPAPVGPRKPDPYLTVRVRDQLDTTTAVGRTHWHIYSLLSGPNVNLNGVSPQGSISLQDLRTNHSTACLGVAADSVGQRLLVTFALGDTTTEQLTPQATADAIVTDWYNGNHTLPAGWKALFITPTDAWDSDQYNAGHGLTPIDPIKWGWDWTAAGVTTFYERTDTDALCSRF
jgi:hypothetical protein